MTPDNDQVGEWQSLREAAASLGLSEKTLRRRVKAGVLESRQVETPHGPAWQVWVDGVRGPAPTVDGRGTHPVRGPELLEALRMIERQQQTILELSGRVGYFQAQLEQARETIRALETPKGTGIARDTTPSGEAVSEPATRPWWRRVFGL